MHPVPPVESQAARLSHEVSNGVEQHRTLSFQTRRLRLTLQSALDLHPQSLRNGVEDGLPRPTQRLLELMTPQPGAVETISVNGLNRAAHFSQEQMGAAEIVTRKPLATAPLDDVP